MSHPVVPTDFPIDPELGDIHTTNEDAEWTYTNIGWVKTIIVLNDANPIWAARP